MGSSKTSKLIKKLKDAYKVCKDCGTKYGVYSVGCSSTWVGHCDVCGGKKPVTEARDYGYLVTGIHQLTLKAMEQSTETDSEVKYSSKVTETEIHRFDGHSHSYTVVRIDDEGGGEYITLSDTDGGSVRLDFEELDMVVAAVRQMRPK